MAEPFIGELRAMAFNFAPRGWADCNGQLLAISQNEALFSLIGTIYGGDGRTTLRLPDLRGRAPVHFGQGPGLSNLPQGASFGAETATLIPQNLPSHEHPVTGTASATLHAETVVGDRANPTNHMLSISGQDTIYGPADDANNIAMHPDSITVDTSGLSTGAIGSSVPFGIHDPSLAVRWCIALVGVFPSRP